MTRKENIGIYSVGFDDLRPAGVLADDLRPAGVLAKVLRVAPLHEKGAQVFLSIESRIEFKKPKSSVKPLKTSFTPYFDNLETALHNRFQERIL
jgi:hypothetical protein